MNKKATYFLTLISSLLLILIAQIYFLYQKQKRDVFIQEEKNVLVSIHQLPDLAMDSKAMYVRHRSLSDMFSIFMHSPELQEFYPNTYVYSHSHILKNTPSIIKAQHEK